MKLYSESGTVLGRFTEEEMIHSCSATGRPNRKEICVDLSILLVDGDSTASAFGLLQRYCESLQFFEKLRRKKKGRNAFVLSL